MSHFLHALTVMALYANRRDHAACDHIPLCEREPGRMIRSVPHLYSWPNVLKLRQILREFRPKQPHIQALFQHRGSRMRSYVVVGAGPVGRETARLLAEAGHSVVLTSRNAGALAAGPVHTVSADASDAAQLIELSKGADVILMCAMAAYHRWPTEFFPIMDGTVKAAEANGAKLVVLGNLYGYGANAPLPLKPDLPPDPSSRKGTVRHIMWQRVLAAKVPAIEVRASDYLGHGAVTYFSLLALPALLQKQRSVSFPGDPDAIHAWSFTKDTARTLVAAADYQGEWGRAFHVPTQDASVRSLVGRFATALDFPTPALHQLTPAELEGIGFHEAIEMLYLFEKPLLADADETMRLLGITPSSLDSMIADTLRV